MKAWAEDEARHTAPGKNVQRGLKVRVELMMAHHFVARETSSHWHVSSRCFVMCNGGREQSPVSVDWTDLKETVTHSDRSGLMWSREFMHPSIYLIGAHELVFVFFIWIQAKDYTTVNFVRSVRVSLKPLPWIKVTFWIGNSTRFHLHVLFHLVSVQVTSSTPSPGVSVTNLTGPHCVTLDCVARCVCLGRSGRRD